ncbi:transcriptional regulator [Sporolactobacillus inulinus]|uniref:Transcriptional regulator n=1 Tax=Sporolactobacillus inulinus TaxID=2078 RepID=A0A4Y1Z9G2_9BACL|nr:hypothetical protein [Sporolactobacillus inulinus]GAY75654.1 transcriptional regulator [Sporolactobacillus inulinus]
MDRAINTPKLKTIPDQWTAQILARILVHHHVIMVSDLVEANLITDMHMSLATSLDQALEMAYEREGKDAKIVVIPDGLGVIVR